MTHPPSLEGREEPAGHAFSSLRSPQPDEESKDRALVLISICLANHANLMAIDFIENKSCQDQNTDLGSGSAAHRQKMNFS